MGCCCCCYPRPNSRVDQQIPGLQQGQLNYSEDFSFPQNVHHQARRSVKPACICEVCGADVDPILFDGHQEACRTNHLRAILAKNAALLSHASIQPLSSPKFTDEVASRDKQLCVVCMDRPRCYAFLPCGHISCCQECTKSLDQCPLCRQPREGLCQVSLIVTAQYECKHCHELIVPTLFDGHREVCGLRQRQAQREAKKTAAEAKAAASAACVAEDNAERSTEPASSSLARRASTDPTSHASSPPAATPDTLPAPPRNLACSHLHLCLECSKTFAQLVVCVPCGHRVLCYTCSRRLTTCPVCLSEIRDTIVAFD
ncbi:hypothetical protein JKF63_00394 [Porcisia hertigi]|uniref:RING-type domain-containing protein n=1 Tax=Porcisia hertigi TaxID=2761500 RepID=A0A836HD16_9TRYP|nr:hypothetical protein JKF63_00394 [Porcisia hertigi]